MSDACDRHTHSTQSLPACRTFPARHTTSSLTSPSVPNVELASRLPECLLALPCALLTSLLFPKRLPSLPHAPPCSSPVDPRPSLPPTLARCFLEDEQQQKKSLDVSDAETCSATSTAACPIVGWRISASVKRKACFVNHEEGNGECPSCKRSGWCLEGVVVAGPDASLDS